MTEELNTTTLENVSGAASVEPAATHKSLNGTSAQSAVHPLAQLFGKYKDELLWDEFMAEVEAYRRERNAQEDVE